MCGRGHDEARLESRALNQQSSILSEPLPGRRRTLIPTLAIALTTRLHPDNAVNVRVIVGRPGSLTKARGRNVAPLTPLLAGAEGGDAALVDDEVGGQAGGLEMRRQGEGEVALVVGVGALGVGLALLGDEGVVVGDVGREAADLGGAVGAGELDDLGVQLGGWEGVRCGLTIGTMWDGSTYKARGCRPSPASRRGQRPGTGGRWAAAAWRWRTRYPPRRRAPPGRRRESPGWSRCWG